MSEKNQVQIMESPAEIMNRFIEVKLDYITKRKAHQIETITQDIKNDISRYVFIKSIIDEELIITKRPTADIITDLGNIPKIHKIDDSFDYLLNMSIRSMTEERLQKLINQIKTAKAGLDKLKSTSPEDIWLGELD